jgi:cytochrome c553
MRPARGRLDGRMWAALTALAGVTVLVAAAPAMAQASGSGSGGGDRALGEYLAGECVTCHQVGGGGGIAAITAWPDEQFVAVLDSYRRKERDNAVMQTIAGRLSDEDMAALAAYFGSLAPAPAVEQTRQGK